jgi:hypothetical protein
MRGTRYGDFSRLEAEADKDYRAVLLQQGRVQLDADANVQIELAQNELEVSLRDLLGDGWAPPSDPGFEISALAPLAFDGHSALALAQGADAAALTPRVQEPHTIELWLTWAGGGGIVLDASDRDGAVACYRLEVRADGVLLLTIAGGPPIVLQASTPLVVGIEAHVAIVFDDGYVTLLVDFRQLARASVRAVSSLRTMSSPTALVLGSTITPGSEPGFRGLVAAVRLWGVQLSPAQLAAGVDPLLGEEGERHAPLAWWRFELPDANSLTDVEGKRSAQALGDWPPQPRLVDLRIGAGRYYVGGVRCERPRDITYREQGAPARTPLPTRGRHLVYLEAWEETVCASEDPQLLEVALGGLDTAVRTRIATRVRVAELDGDRLPLPEPESTGRLAARHEGAPVPGNRLYRVEVHASGVLSADTTPEWEIAVVEIDFERWEIVLAEAWAGSRSGPFEIVVGADAAPGEQSLHRHTVAGVHNDEQGSRLRLATDPSSLSDRRGLRVRGAPPLPTFKWSRNNGADLFAIVPAHGHARTAEVLPARWLAPLAAGDVVEPLSEHATVDGPSPALLRVEHDPDEAGRIRLAGTLPDGTTLLRRWDHPPQEEAQGAIAGEVRWTELEDGISVQAKPGTYRRGDFWWILARQDLGSIEWPRRGGHPRALAPAGIERRTAPLARLTLRHGMVEVEDLRTIGGAPTATDVEEVPPGQERGGTQELGDEDTRSGEADRDAARTVPSHRIVPTPSLTAAPSRRAAQPVRTVELAEPATKDLGEVVQRSGWRLLSTVDRLEAGLEDLASTAHGIVLATSQELVMLHPQSGALERLAELPAPRLGFSLQALAGELLLFGGHTKNALADGRVMAVNASSGEWHERARLPGPREGVAIAVVEGVVHALGGHARGILHGQRASHHVYEAERDRWRRASPRLPARIAHAAALALDGRVCVIGGLERDGATARGVNQTLRRDGRAWRSQPPVPGPRHVLDACPHDGQIVVLVEDREGDRPPSTLVFEPTTAMWLSPVALPEGLERPGLVAHQGRVLLAGETSSGISLYENTLLAPVRAERERGNLDRADPR